MRKNQVEEGERKAIRNKGNVLFNGSQPPQRLVPPGTANTVGLDILLLIMLPLLFTLIVWMLYTDIGLDFTTGSLETE